MDKEQFYTHLQNADSLNEQTLESLKNITEEFPWFQAGWMLYLKNLKNCDDPAYETVLKKVAVMVPERKNLFRYLNSELPAQQPSIEKLKAASSLYQLEGESSESDSLIDRFLNSGSSVIRKKTDGLYSVENKEHIEKSVAENDEIITETLAAIYFQQKNYEKAQRAYQKLSLKYPEKSVYFAARIKEIEVLKNNN
jgi:tetratricopeptide (TPR) repeat protein